jgi:prepilin-type processing-associated H-X9-DG protein
MTRQRGATLTDTLVVVGIVASLLALALPAIQRVRGAADRTACQSQLRQVGQALHLFHGDHGRFGLSGSLLPGSRFRNLSWLATLLPYVDEKALFLQAEQAAQHASNVQDLLNFPTMQAVVRLYVCPTDSRLRSAQTDAWGTTAALISYLGSSGGMTSDLRGYRGAVPGVKLEEILDGASTTIAVGERPPPDSWQAGWWYPNIHMHHVGNRGPHIIMVVGVTGAIVGSGASDCRATFRATGPGRTSNPCDRFHFWSLHGGGSNFLFVDGSVRFLAYSADPILPALISINGGENVTLPD